MELGLDAAFSNFTPKENDVLKSHTRFAVFANGKWNGTLNNMQPHGGYMYYSSEPATLTYSSSRAMMINSVEAADESNPVWSFDPSEYPDNMTVVAELYNDNVKTIEGAYTVGAFCGDECRGIGQYDGGLLYITIHGIPDNSIRFKAVENATGMEAEIKESLSFTDMPVGTVNNPYCLSLDTNSSVGSVYSGYDLNIYPNPVRDRLFIEGEVSGITGVKVLSVNGVTMLSVKGHEQGVDVASIVDGVYVAAIFTSDGVVYRKFVKKGY